MALTCLAFLIIITTKPEGLAVMLLLWFGQRHWEKLISGWKCRAFCEGLLESRLGTKTE